MSKFKKDKIIIFSLGGSLIFKKNSFEFDLIFLKKFKKFLLEFLNKNYKFVIIVGGGFLAKAFIEKAKNFNKDLTYKDLDYLGIKITELNALFLKTIFKDISYFKIFNQPNLIFKKTNKKILFVYGLKPGYSTDFVSVLWAKKLNVEKVINLTNVDYIYDKNPNKFKDAKPILKINFQDYLNKIANFRWQPKLSLPFDPVATELAFKERIKIVIVNGKNLSNLKKVILGEKFKGSEIIF